jgi:Ser/Thr protein kinase RdoA (MazF antagonist)
MRALAGAVLARYPIGVDKFTLLQHGFNTTFRVDARDGRRFALRLNVNSRRSPANVEAEVAWVAAVSRDTGLSVACPLANRAGEYVTTLPSVELDRDVHAVVFSWLTGRDAGLAPTVEKATAMGRAMATLHDHARQWSLPAGSALPALTDVFWNMPDRLDHAHLELGAAEISVLREAVDIVSAVTSRVVTGPLRPIHADLHLWNVKWNRGRLAVLDFDDSGMGAPVQDLAVSTFYLRPRHDLVEALREGYTSVARLPQATDEDFETLVAQRNLLLLNDLLATTNAEHRGLVPRYARNTVLKVRNWLDTGTFRHDIDGLLPLD